MLHHVKMFENNLIKVSIFNTWWAILKKSDKMKMNNLVTLQH